MGSRSEKTVEPEKVCTDDVYNLDRRILYSMMTEFRENLFKKN